MSAPKAFEALILVGFAASCIAVAAAIAFSIFVPKKPSAAPNEVSIDGGHLLVREWADEKTGKRYLIFQRYTNGLFVIEAALPVESK